MAYECRVSLDAHKFLVINPSHFAAIALYHSTTLSVSLSLPLFSCSFSAASRQAGVEGREGAWPVEVADGAGKWRK